MQQPKSKYDSVNAWLLWSLSIAVSQFPSIAPFIVYCRTGSIQWEYGWLSSGFHDPGKEEATSKGELTYFWGRKGAWPIAITVIESELAVPESTVLPPC